MTRPLLNRRQLSLLILLLPGVILLLSLLGPAPDAEADRWQASEDQRIYQRQVPGQTVYRLHLLLPQAPADSIATRLEQRLLLAALQQRIAATDLQPEWQHRLGAAPQVQLRPGYLLLQFSLNRPPVSSDLDWLLQQLQQPPALDWPALLQRVQAEQYLSRQEPETWLLSQYSSKDTGQRMLDPSAAYRQWFRPADWRLTLSAPEPVPLVLATTAHADASLTSQLLQLSALPVAVPAPQHPLQLHRWPLPALDSIEHFALTLLARAAVQQQLAAELAQQPPGTPAGFSLNWTPALPQGQASLILQGNHWPLLPGWLPEQMASVDLAAARAQVEQQIRRPDQQQAWADLMALHQLPADTLTRLPAMLAAIQPSELQRWLQVQLKSDYYHTLSLPASP